MVTIIPLNVFMLIVNQKADDRVKSKILETSNTYLESYVADMEKEFVRLKNLQQEYINDKDLLNLSELGELLGSYEWTKAINRLTNRVEILAASSPIIKEVTIYIPLINEEISSRNGLNKLFLEKMERALEVNDQASSMLLASDERLFLSSYHPEIVRKGSLPSFLIQIELSANSLLKTLEQFPMNWSGTAVIAGREFILSDDRSNRATQNSIWTKSLELIPELQDANFLQYRRFSELLAAEFIVNLPKSVIYGETKVFQIWFWVIFFFSLSLIFVFSYSIYRMIQRPLRQLVKAFSQMEYGNFNHFIKNNRRDEFSYLYNRYNETVSNLKIMIDEVYISKIQVQQANLKQLQAQINPHFLYNSFYTLYQMIKQEDEKALIFAKCLGEYFQYITKNAEDEVPLWREIQHAKDYVTIQSVRFYPRIQVDFRFEAEQAKDCLVPRLILQPIIENAFNHGLEDIDSHGELGIHIYADDANVHLIVEDNGRGLTEEEISELNCSLDSKTYGKEVTGMINVHQRLKLKFKQDAGIRLGVSESKGGLRVHMTFPYTNE